jgi:hypothetical protein
MTAIAILWPVFALMTMWIGFFVDMLGATA